MDIPKRTTDRFEACNECAKDVDTDKRHCRVTTVYASKDGMLKTGSAAVCSDCTYKAGLALKPWMHDGFS